MRGFLVLVCIAVVAAFGTYTNSKKAESNSKKAGTPNGALAIGTERVFIGETTADGTVCFDGTLTLRGNADRDGDGCAAYGPWGCERSSWWKTATFNAAESCCICGGGHYVPEVPLVDRLTMVEACKIEVDAGLGADGCTALQTHSGPDGITVCQEMLCGSDTLDMCKQAGILECANVCKQAVDDGVQSTREDCTALAEAGVGGSCTAVVCGTMADACLEQVDAGFGADGCTALQAHFGPDATTDCQKMLCGSTRAHEANYCKEAVDLGFMSEQCTALKNAGVGGSCTAFICGSTTGGESRRDAGFTLANACMKQVDAGLVADGCTALTLLSGWTFCREMLCGSIVPDGIAPGYYADGCKSEADKGHMSEECTILENAGVGGPCHAVVCGLNN